MNDTPQVAFIGTGAMGDPMARRLLAAGVGVRVWNRTASKLRSLMELGATIADAPADAVEGRNVAFLCLASAAAMEEVIFGSKGIIASRDPPKVIADFATIGPSRTAEFAERTHRAIGCSWVDAPVSGGVAGAQNGKLVIFCGGNTQDIDSLKPLLTHLSQRITHVGGLGSGQTLKLCNQLIVSSNVIAIAEAMWLAKSAGLDLAVIPEALAGGFADSTPLQIFGQRMASGISEPVLGEVSLMLKDVIAVEELAQNLGVDLSSSREIARIYRRAADFGLMKQDLSRIFALYSRT